MKCDDVFNTFNNDCIAKNKILDPSFNCVEIDSCLVVKSFVGFCSDPVLDLNGTTIYNDYSGLKTISDSPFVSNTVVSPVVSNTITNPDGSTTTTTTASSTQSTFDFSSLTSRLDVMIESTKNVANSQIEKLENIDSSSSSILDYFTNMDVSVDFDSVPSTNLDSNDTSSMSILENKLSTTLDADSVLDKARIDASSLFINLPDSNNCPIIPTTSLDFDILDSHFHKDLFSQDIFNTYIPVELIQQFRIVLMFVAAFASLMII